MATLLLLSGCSAPAYRFTTPNTGRPISDSDDMEEPEVTEDERHPYSPQAPLAVDREAEAQDLAIAKRHAAALARARTFVPRDSSALVFYSSPHLVLVFQFRVEFYRLRSGEAWLVEGKDLSSSRQPFWDGGLGRMGAFSFTRDGRVVERAPDRIVRFGRPIRVQDWVAPPRSSAQALLVSTDSRSGNYYFASDREEGEVMEEMERGGVVFEYFPSKYDWEEFYGVWGLDGTLLGRLNEQADPPKVSLKGEIVDVHGAVAVWAVGPLVASRDGGLILGENRDYRVWRRGKGVQRMSREQMAAAYPQWAEWLELKPSGAR